MHQGKGPLPQNFKFPPLPHNPLSEFIRTSIQFAFGGQVGDTEAYAPFRVDSSQSITIGEFGQPSDKLVVTYELP